MTKTIVAKKPRMLFALIFSAFLLLKFIQEGISLSMLLLLLLKTFYQHPPPGIIIRRSLHLNSILFFLLSGMWEGVVCVSIFCLCPCMFSHGEFQPTRMLLRWRWCTLWKIAAQNRSCLISPFFAKTPSFPSSSKACYESSKKYHIPPALSPLKFFFCQSVRFEVREFSVPKKQDSTVVINSTREFFSRFAGKWAINKVQRLTHLHLPRKSNLNF